MERALQLDGDLPLFVALTIRASLGAYAGRIDEARRDVSDALAAGHRCGSCRLAEWPIATLGFLELSLGHHEAALNTSEPLLSKLGAAPDGTEIIAAAFLPDAVEAMIHLVGSPTPRRRTCSNAAAAGSTAPGCWPSPPAAEACCSQLKATSALRASPRTGRWPNTSGCRCRSNVRTNLLLGQLHRRQRHKDAASTNLQEALTTFENLDVPLWADRACSLARNGRGKLTSVYRKLGIHSRAELGRRIAQSDEQGNTRFARRRGP